MVRYQYVNVASPELDLGHAVVRYQSSFEIGGSKEHRWVQGVSTAKVPSDLVVFAFLLSSAPTWLRSSSGPLHVELPRPMSYRSYFILRRILDYQRAGAGRLTIDHEYDRVGEHDLVDRSGVMRMNSKVAQLSGSAPRCGEESVNDILLNFLARSVVAGWGRDTEESVVELNLPADMFWSTLDYDNAWPFSPSVLGGFRAAVTRVFGRSPRIVNRLAEMDVTQAPWLLLADDVQRTVRAVNAASPLRSARVEEVLRSVSSEGAVTQAEVSEFSAEDIWHHGVTVPHLLEAFCAVTYRGVGFASMREPEGIMTWRGRARVLSKGARGVGPLLDPLVV